MNIKQALAALDPQNDDQWTADGLPRVEAVSTLLGGEVTRRQITDADPSFVRPQGSGFDPVGTPPNPTPEPDPKPEDKPAEDKPAEEPTEAPPKETPAPEPNAPGAEPPSEEDPLIPPENPDDAAEVKALDDVVGMGVQEVYSDVDLVTRAIEEFSRQGAILSARKDAIEKKLSEIGRRGASLQKVLNRLGKSNAAQQRETLKRYQEQCRVSREKRAAQTQKFIEAGTTAKEVKEQLEGPSKIDAAMKQRKAQRGAARPAYPMTATT